MRVSGYLRRLLRVAPIVGLVAPLAAQANDIDLSTYQLTASYALPRGDFSTNPAVINAHEVSAITYNWDTQTLFVVGDEGGHITEVSLDGVPLSKMAILGFNDPEGLTYVGNGQLMLVEERNRDVYRVTYASGGFVFKTSLTAIDLGTFVDNIGLEGISYDPRDGSFVTVKEKTPQEVNANQLDFTAFTATTSPIFTPNLGVADIADVQVLSTVPSLAGSAEADHLLLVSQESRVLLEVDRAGNVLGQFSLSGLPDSVEGVTIDPDGNIYLVAENGSDPMMYVLSPPPAPASTQTVPFAPWWALGLLGGALSVIGARVRRRG